MVGVVHDGITNLFYGEIPTAIAVSGGVAAVDPFTVYTTARIIGTAKK